ncbi:hypothetical protein [Nocardia cyriacigeorgica]|uniref:hypothetical protein n=1 Tax=Nocardia cyriacigeorgica TaxID=135487 RepID=UPI0024550967|nr:hypothetical protein [Nocardia cyriacigeorgica]
MRCEVCSEANSIANTTMHFPEALCIIGEGKGVTIVANQIRDCHTRPDVAYVPLLGAPPIRYGLLWSTDRVTAPVRELAGAMLREARRDLATGELGQLAQHVGIAPV